MRSRWLDVVTVLCAPLVGGIAGGCKGSSDDSSGTPPPPGVTMTRAAVAAALGTCTLEVYRAFVPAADELATATAALAQDGSPERWEAARAAWVKAIGLWQEAEVFQYGPAGPAKDNPGGREIRGQIYSWPLTSRCLIEQQLASQGYSAPDFPKSLINVRGLAAAEYLLFHQGTDAPCASPMLAPEELERRKRAYAAAVATDVAQRAHELVDAWDPAKGNFLRETTSAEAGSTVYTSSQAVLSSMGHALYYIEYPVKDEKLARPLGRKNCDMPPCLGTLESRYALRSKDHVRRNLDGFEKLAFGCGGTAPQLGFDDLLQAIGAAPVADKMRAQLLAARQALDAIPGDDFRDSLATDLAPMGKVHDAVKSIVDIMKMDLKSLLGLTPPMAVGSDTD